jgi:hypothetical protein
MVVSAFAAALLDTFTMLGAWSSTELAPPDHKRRIE